MRYKRSSFVFFSLQNKQVFDLQAFLRGQMHFEAKTEVQAYPILTGATVALSREALECLAEIGVTWEDAGIVTERSGVPVEQLNQWCCQGLVLCDSGDAELVKMRLQEEALETQQWHPVAALFHFMNRGSAEAGAEEVEVSVIESVAESSSDAAAELVKRYGPPPPEFHHLEKVIEKIPLASCSEDGRLYELLGERHTLRSFDPYRLLDLERLTTLLYYTFGYQGSTDVTEGIRVLHKTSPSGGGMHPIEAYPVVLRVQGLEPGVYHYNVERHELELLRRLSVEEAEAALGQVANGQGFVASAHVVVLLAARFFRNFWKYRRIARTYGVLLMDAAHLSQTFYLTAADLDLGAFYTASINARRAEGLLGIDGLEEGVLALCGCGIKPPGGGVRLERVKESR